MKFKQIFIFFLFSIHLSDKNLFKVIAKMYLVIIAHAQADRAMIQEKELEIFRCSHEAVECRLKVDLD